MSIDYIFTGHESFSIRDGWLIKGIDLINEKKNEGKNGKIIFSHEEIYNTIDRLGIGANMVKSLKFWLEVLDILQDDGEINPVVMEILKFDKYFQKIETLWLLHFFILNPNKRNRRALLWDIVSKENNYNSFEKKEMIDLINSKTGKRYSKNSIGTTLEVFIRTYFYNGDNKKISDPETNLISPFNKLNLLQKRELDNYTFRTIGHKEINTFFGYYIMLNILKSKNRDMMGINEIYQIFKKTIKVNSYDFDILIKHIADNNLINIDRAAGLNNIILKNKLYEKEVIKKIYQK